MAKQVKRRKKNSKKGQSRVFMIFVSVSIILLVGELIALNHINSKKNNNALLADSTHYVSETNYLMPSPTPYVKPQEQNVSKPIYNVSPTSTVKQEPNVTKRSTVSSTIAPSQKTEAFTNLYGTPTTKCAHKGCKNNIASSGDTNCCTVHSRRCLECGKYIDEDATWCMSCILKAANSIRSGK